VEVDTPALLNLIKHCQDNRELATTIDGHFKNGVHGILAGILKKEIDVDNLFITNAQISTEVKSKTEVHNQVGFYVSCQLGLAFSIQNLRLLIKTYKNFRNSVMIIYDINKSTYGLNPFQCFRLSE